MSNHCQALLSVYHAQTMYNIKQAAARAGVTVPVLRAWERRYGIVDPNRTASGYRQFDDAAIARVRTMRRLVDEGWAPSAAAAAILAGTVDVPSHPDAASAAEDPGGRMAADDAAGMEVAALTARFLQGAADLDPHEVGSVLDDAFAHGSFERVAADYLFPALEALGEAWAAGRVTVAGEHMASSAVARRLGQALEAAGDGISRAGRVVVGMPPGGRHELGALVFAIAARRAGLPVVYLGADLPVDDWLAAAEGAAAAVIGAVTARDRAAATDLAHRLRAADPALIVAVGGRTAPVGPNVLRLPAELPASVATLADALDAARDARTPAKPR
jgi:methanogenic corrinoid protein MtbC1